jgi:P-type E1-E2 ATPase
MPCDCIVLTGTVIVNEAMLTGESIPVIKSSLPNTEEVVLDPKYMLYSGTRVIQARGGVDGTCCALVVRTGFLTTKGSLVRDILYPKPIHF